MAVEPDNYSLPYAIADSPKELEAMTGVDARKITYHISRFNKGIIKKAKYVKVEVEE